ncbi:MAG TPA: hypothetical protein VHF24_00745 [Acidimicrobiales bacterium]|nr:hypothetical protein [Acidimicrobiales bacterium]
MTATSSKRWLVAVVACGTFASAVAAGLIFVRDWPETPDAGVVISVTKSIVERHDVSPARDWRGRPMREQKYGLGLSLLFAGPYGVARLVDADPIPAAMATNAFVFGFTAISLLALARLLDASWGQALVTTLLIAAGTPLLPFVATGFSELAVAATVTLGLGAVAGAGKGRAWAAPLAGAAAGAATLLRTDSLVLVLPVLAVGLVVASRERRSVWDFCLAAAPFLLAWGWYNHIRYGAPWRLGYYEDEGFIYPFMRGLYGLVLSPGRGLLWYAPLVLLAVVGVRAAWRRNPTLAAVAAILFLARPLFYASWAWEGGWTWGPRFLVPAMPALLVGVVEVVRRLPSWPRAPQLVAAVVVVLSVSVQVVGVSTDYLPSNAAVAQVHEDFHAGLLSWDHFPIVEQAHWMLTGRDVYVGWALPPERRPILFASLVATSVLMAFAAVLAARRLSGVPQVPRHPRDGVPLLAPSEASS